MKQILIVVSTVILLSCNTELFAQLNTARTDTTKQHFIITDSLAYLEKIAVNKQKYIHQPLSVLLNDLKIPVKSYSLVGSNISKSWGMWIYFDNFYNTKEARWNSWDKDPVAIILEWTSPLSFNNWGFLKLVGNRSGEWTETEQNYFSNKIISDIVLPFRKGQ